MIKIFFISILTRDESQRDVLPISQNKTRLKTLQSSFAGQLSLCARFWSYTQHIKGEE